ncbi:DUF1761 domain-containing protein [Candidatus Woesearchaeota archaeon]|nr:DUF1761 domain-containing protein [Candidatus Woesearchaeota archaeon]
MVNYLAVIVVAILNMVIGFLWYGPLFGKQWIRLMGFDAKKMKDMKNKGMTTPMIFGFISSLIMAYVLGLFVEGLNTSGILSGVIGGVIISFLIWLGFVATIMLGTVLWEGKPIKLYILNILYWLISLLIMGMILSVWI